MESLQSIFMLTKLFGFNAYTYRNSSSKRTTESAWCRTGLILVGLNMAANVFFSMQNADRTKLNYGKSGSHLLDVGGQLLLGFSYASMLAAIVIRLTRRGLVEKMLNRFRLIDQRMAAVGILMDHRREARLVVGYIGLFLGIVTIAALGGLYMLYLLDSIRHGALIYGGQVFVSYSGLVLGHSCFIINQTLVRRIQFLNHHLSQDFKLRQIKTKKRNTVDKFHQQISEIAFIFDDMHKLSIDLSFLLWTEIATFCCVDLVYGIMTLYAVYRAVSIGNYENVLTSGVHMIWWIEYSLAVVNILAAGHSMQMATRRTLALLGAAGCSETDGLVTQKIQCLMLQIGHNAPKITTWLFDVNLTVLYGMVGTLATFLFIMIQFGL